MTTAFKTSLLAGLALCASATTALAGPTETYAEVLQRGLVDGADDILLFDYAAAAQNGDHAIIEAFVAEQAEATPSQMSEAEALAYWGNLYNAITLDVILDEYPVKSIRKIGGLRGPWDRDVVTVEGETLSLNDIEHVKMREQYPSPYIHYMVNCASIGCPNVQRELWTAETLEADQKAAAAEYINSDRGLRLDGDEFSMSKIYKWYKEDFGTRNELRDHLATYATGARLEALKSGVRIRGSHYDWDLNEVAK